MCCRGLCSSTKLTATRQTKDLFTASFPNLRLPILILLSIGNYVNYGIGKKTKYIYCSIFRNCWTVTKLNIQNMSSPTISKISKLWHRCFWRHAMKQARQKSSWGPVSVLQHFFVYIAQLYLKRDHTDDDITNNFHCEEESYHSLTSRIACQQYEGSSKVDFEKKIYLAAKYLKSDN